ncbi:MAG: terminase, partial [Alphaproteobacteria bacterium]|nr:terminase [Alphaproteobacteria bacterium]
MSTMKDTRIVITANTENQLRTKTWPEVSKWSKLSSTSHLWQVPAMSIYSSDPGAEKSWRGDAIPWSENNTEAFAGLHNEGKRIVLVFDEGSKIADKVWEVAEGALTDTDTEIIWLAFGNPTQNTGRFRECFAKQRHLWRTRHIDSRTVEGTNKEYLNELVETYGEDSDFVRVRVRGVFPRAGAVQFISGDVVEAAQTRALPVPDPGAPLVLGVDIARFGDDQCVIRGRQGRNGRVIPPIKWRDRDTVFSAGKIAWAIDKYNPQAVFIDGGGVGGGVVDLLKSRGYRVIEVNFGSAARKELQYANKRAEMWGDLRDWLATGVIDADQQLSDDLQGPEYAFDKDGRILLEKKDDMKRRGVASPDDGDALALTFAMPIQRTDMPTSRDAGRRAQ